MDQVHADEIILLGIMFGKTLWAEGHILVLDLLCRWD